MLKESCKHHDACTNIENCGDCEAKWKIEDLKQDIKNLGFQVEETREGEIKISEHN